MSGCEPSMSSLDRDRDVRRMDAEADPLQAWLDCMRCGEWERAWNITDRAMPRRAHEPCAHWPRHLQYVWTGGTLTNRRVLVRCYHGLGDTLQFIRYMPLLKTVAREVIVWVQPSLIRLLEGMDGVDRFLPLHDGTPEVEYDVDVELMELPYIFRTTLATVPAKIPYVRAEPMPLPFARTKPVVGLVWKAGEWNGGRSLSLPLLAPLAAVRGITLCILQPQAVASGWNGEFGTFLGEFDLFDYARAVRAMDLLITVDSMPAHIAGALGVPVWTLLGAKADWRWMRDREDTPWYPGMRLFRQVREGDWESVVAKVAGELERFAQS
jgi:hypothetical protein